MLFIYINQQNRSLSKSLSSAKSNGFLFIITASWNQYVY